MAETTPPADGPLSRDRVELTILALGIALRLSMLWSFPPVGSYDYPDHWKYVDWFRLHWELPPLLYSRECYHPPLFYFLSGVLLRIGATNRGVQLFALFTGALRLVVVAVGFRRYLPGRRLARRVGLALLAVVPVSLHLDGMVNSEALLCLFAAVAMLLIPPVFDADGRTRARRAALLGVVLGLGLLTKISTLTLFFAVGAAALGELVLRAGPPRARVARAALVGVTLVVAGTIAGWYFVRNAQLYGKPFLSGFDGVDRGAFDAWRKVPYLKRRPVSWVLGWSSDVYARPYSPSGIRPVSRLMPVVIASTFVDFYKYDFGPLTKERKPTPITLALAQASVVGGTVIALVTFAAWLAAFACVWRRRAFGMLALLLVPLIVLVGQIHFAWYYPVDGFGPVKGGYFQFGNPPLCALFGLGVAWLWQRRGFARAAAFVALAALVTPALYDVYCRLAKM